MLTTQFLAERFDAAVFSGVVALASFTLLASFLPVALTDDSGERLSSLTLTGTFRALGFFAGVFLGVSVLTTTSSSRAPFFGLPRFLTASLAILHASDNVRANTRRSEMF